MKHITYITTTAACDDTFDKISHLNSGFHAYHFTKDIIVLRGNFLPDVFEWIESPFNHSYQRYAKRVSKHHAIITEERYDDMHEVLPPVYFSHIDGNRVQRGMCCSEAYNHTDQGYVVLTCCYRLDGVYYETLAVVFKNNDKPIFDTYNEVWSNDNYAITYIK